MRCADVMRRDVQGCRATETIRSVAVRMRDDNVGFLPVKDEEGTVVGVVTDRDLVLRGLADSLDPDQTTVEKVMTAEVHFVRDTEPLKEAEDLMARRHVSRVLVMNEGGELVGVISLSDLGKSEWGWRVARTVRALGTT